MGRIVRFGISMEAGLLRQLDACLRREGYGSRSEAIRDMVRERLVEKEWAAGSVIAGTILLVYSHHQRELVEKILDIQHDFHQNIISTQHIHLDHDHCLETVAVQGRAREVQKLADSIRAVKGVQHGTLSMTGTGRETE